MGAQSKMSSGIVTLCGWHKTYWPEEGEIWIDQAGLPTAAPVPLPERGMISHGLCLRCAPLWAMDAGIEDGRSEMEDGRMGTIFSNGPEGGSHLAPAGRSIPPSSAARLQTPAARCSEGGRHSINMAAPAAPTVVGRGRRSAETMERRAA